MLFEALCEDEHCLIVGSAPGVTIPDSDFGCVIGVNGGAAIARDKGLQVDVLVTTSHLFRGGDLPPIEQWTIDTMSNLQVDHVWADTKNGPLGLVEEGCDEHNISYLDLFEVTPEQRSEVIMDAIGVDLWISSGIWAVCLALSGGSASVKIAGISLINGHHGAKNDMTPRHHVLQDGQCLDILRTMESVW